MSATSRGIVVIRLLLQRRPMEIDGVTDVPELMIQRRHQHLHRDILCAATISDRRGASKLRRHAIEIGRPGNPARRIAAAPPALARTRSPAPAPRVQGRRRTGTSSAFAPVQRHAGSTCTCRSSTSPGHAPLRVLPREFDGRQPRPQKIGIETDE